MRYVIYGLALVLLLLHQDCWFWGDDSLVAGFMPVGLAYHALFSLTAAVLWAVAIKVAWPTHLEEWADASEPADAAEESGR